MERSRAYFANQIRRTASVRALIGTCSTASLHNHPVTHGGANPIEYGIQADYCQEFADISIAEVGRLQGTYDKSGNTHFRQTHPEFIEVILVQSSLNGINLDVERGFKCSLDGSQCLRRIITDAGKLGCWSGPQVVKRDRKVV